MTARMTPREYRLSAVLFALVAILYISSIGCYDLATWFLEVAPVLIALPILVATARRFPLTTLLYLLIFVHALVLIMGGHYTYARVPLGFWIQDAFSFARNPYDKIGHFMQGFAPFLVSREILLRGRFLESRAMTGFLSVCVVMAISAWYELIEWWTALAFGQGATEFLGTQGDPWDTQSDMLFACIGAIAAWLLLSRLHDRQIRNIDRSNAA